MSHAINSTNVHGRSGQQITYCRPYVDNTMYRYIYYVDSNSSSQIELGTYEYPFKNMDSPPKEIFNYMYEKQTNFTVYHKRGLTYKMYYGIMPIIALNVDMYYLTDYGDPSLNKPYVYIVGYNYLWPNTSMFSLAQEYYDFTTRVSRGDMSQSEASIFFLKFNIFRSSQYVQNIDFQSIFYGTAWSNPLFYTFDAPNEELTIENCYLDLDGALMEGYSPIAEKLTRSHINLTNYQYGIWN